MKTNMLIRILSLVSLFVLLNSPENCNSENSNIFSQGSAGYYYNPPTLVGDYIYIGTSMRSLADPANDNYFFKLDSKLSKIWDYPLGKKEVRGAASLDSFGNIYFIVEAGRGYGDHSNSEAFLFSLSPNGKFRWKKKILPIVEIMPVSNVNNMGMYNPAISIDDTIYVGGGWKLYAFDINGNQKWCFFDERIRDIVNAPIIDNRGNIYFSSFEGVVSLTPEGSKRWLYITSGEAFSSPAFSTDYAKIYMGVGEKVYCLTSRNGNKEWEFRPSVITGTFRATPAVDDKNNVYIGTKDNEKSVLYAISANGAQLWEKHIGADLYSSPALGDDRTLYIGSELAEGTIHALDMTTGKSKWSADMSGDVTWSSPALSDNGILYIACMTHPGISIGSVHSFETGSTMLLPNAGSPRFHQGNTSTGRRENEDDWSPPLPWLLLLFENE